MPGILKIVADGLKMSLKKKRRFRNLLIKNGLQEKLFAQVVELLTKRGLILKKGTIVDSTFIEAPCSTKNKEMLFIS